MDLNDTTHLDLSFDGCGINGRDQYRTRIATFTDKRGPVAEKYGPLFAAAPDLLAALQQAVARVTIANSEGDPILSAWLPEAQAAIAKAEGKS